MRTINHRNKAKDYLFLYIELGRAEYVKSILKDQTFEVRTLSAALEFAVRSEQTESIRLLLEHEDARFFYRPGLISLVKFPRQTEIELFHKFGFITRDVDTELIAAMFVRACSNSYHSYPVVRYMVENDLVDLSPFHHEDMKVLIYSKRMDTFQYLLPKMPFTQRDLNELFVTACSRRELDMMKMLDVKGADLVGLYKKVINAVKYSRGKYIRGKYIQGSTKRESLDVDVWNYLDHQFKRRVTHISTSRRSSAGNQLRVLPLHILGMKNEEDFLDIEKTT